MPATLADLKAQVEDLASRFPRLSNDNLFVAWYLVAMLADDERKAVEAVTGVSNDKGVDALFIDDDIKSAFVVQAKYRESIGKVSENHSDVVAFAGLTDTFFGDSARFKEFEASADPLVAEKVLGARTRIQKRGYRIQLHYVTLGKCSSNLRREAEGIVRRDSDRRGEFFLFDGQQVLSILDDYLDGVAPPIPQLELAFEPGGEINRFDRATGIDSWVFTMAGPDIGALFRRTGIRLFARNVRGFLGDTNINGAMRQTLEAEPQFFWYFNNGVTIVCDQAEKIQRKGRAVLKVYNPQVINGQQTTRVLDQAAKKPGASVLVRVIQIPRGVSHADGQFDLLVSRIVQATNWQNAIRPSDLMSNDRQQVAIERELRKVGYQYLRKRQTKGEARRAARAQYRYIIPKEELAQAVAACLLDPQLVRRGKEHLFDESYELVFPTSDADFYLGKFWLLRAVTRASRGFPERAYAKWVVLNFLWSRIGTSIDSRPTAFRRACELPLKNPDVIRHLDRAVGIVFVQALRFFRAERGTGPQAADVSTFFGRRNLHQEFATHWKSPANKQAIAFDRGIDKFRAALKEVGS